MDHPNRSSIAIAGGLLAVGLAACGDNEDSARCSDVPGTSCLWAGVPGERGLDRGALDRRDAMLGLPMDIEFAPDGRPWIADWNNHVIRRVEADDTIHTVMGAEYEGDGPPGEIDRLPLCAPQGADALTVALNHPTDVAFAPDGTVVLAAWHNNKIRVMDPETNVITVLAGDSYGYGGYDVPACEAVFNQPKSIAIDPEGRIYTNDQRNQRVRMIDVDADRTITTVVGTGTQGYAGDGAPAIEAQLSFDASITPDPSGGLLLVDRKLYIADALNARIRVVDLDTGIIDLVAGTGEIGYAGDGGAALDATFSNPGDMELGPDGRIYLADVNNNVIRAIDLDTGTIETVVGNGQQCDGVLFDCTEAEAGAPATEVQLLRPYGLGFDAEGNLFVADTNNSRILRIAK